MISRVLSCEKNFKKIAGSIATRSWFYASDNSYTNKEFFKICGDFKVSHDPMKYRDEKFYWTYQCGVGWPDDYIGPDSMTRWIVEKSQDFANVGLYRISESVRAYTYLILSSQASVRSSKIENTMSALTTQKAFVNNFEDIVNRIILRLSLKHPRRYQALPPLCIK